MKKRYLNKRILASLLVVVSIGFTYAQDGDNYPGSLVPNVITESEGYSQNFDDVTNGVYPSGWGAWNVANAWQSGAYINPRVAGTVTATIAKLNMGGGANTTTSSVYTMTKRIGFKNGTTSDWAIYTALNTEAVPKSKRVNIRFDAMVMRNLFDGVDNTLIFELALQYRVGTTGDFTNLGGTIRNNDVQKTTGTEPAVSDNFTFELPQACSNETHVQLRWITKYISGAESSSNNWPSFAIDNFEVTVEDPVVTYPYTSPHVITETEGYTQDFNAISGGVYPDGWGVWNVGTRQSGANPETNPRITDTTTDIAKLNMGGTAATAIASVYTFNQRLGFKNGTTSDFAIYTALNTEAVPVNKRVNVAFDAMVMRNLYDGTNNDVVLSLALQYRIGTSGTFTNIGETIRNNETQRTSGTEPAVSGSFSFELPEECSNQPYVQLRWITKFVSGTYPANSDDQPSFAIDNFVVTVEDPSSSIGSVSIGSPDLKVYPNPSHGLVYVEISDTDAEQISVSIYNLLGEKVYSKKYDLRKTGHTLNFDLRGKVFSGQYILKITGNGINKTSKLYVL